MTEETPEIDHEEEVIPPATEEAEPGDVLFLSPDESEVVPAEALAFETAELNDKLDAAEAERDDFKNRMIRAAADLDNFRKRANREKDELRKYGIDKVVGELIPVLDNFERALQHTEISEGNQSVMEGVQMIYRQFVSALSKHGVQGFESVGEAFDPTRHEAIQQVETDEHDAGTVVDQFQKGYFLHDRLIRPALVSVSKKPSEVLEQESEVGEQVEDATIDSEPVDPPTDPNVEDGTTEVVEQEDDA